MRRFDVRHLPVLDGGRIVGVLTERDVLFIETLSDVDPLKVTVEEAMSRDVYAVSSATPLAEVVAEMAEHKYGCVVIVDGSRVAGIFTTVDALRMLAAVVGGEDAGRPVATVPAT